MNGSTKFHIACCVIGKSITLRLLSSSPNASGELVTYSSYRDPVASSLCQLALILEPDLELQALHCGDLVVEIKKDDLNGTVHPTNFQCGPVSCCMGVVVEISSNRHLVEILVPGRHFPEIKSLNRSTLLDLQAQTSSKTRGKIEATPIPRGRLSLVVDILEGKMSQRGWMSNVREAPKWDSPSSLSNLVMRHGEKGVSCGESWRTLGMLLSADRQN